MAGNNEQLQPTLEELAWVAFHLPYNFDRECIEILITHSAEQGTMPFRRITRLEKKVIQLAVNPTDWLNIEREILKLDALNFKRDSAERVNTIYGIKIVREVLNEKHNDLVDSSAFAFTYANERRSGGLHISEQETSGTSDQGQ